MAVMAVIKYSFRSVQNDELSKLKMMNNSPHNVTNRTVPLTRSDGESKLVLKHLHHGCNKVNIDMISYIKACVLNHGLKLC